MRLTGKERFFIGIDEVGRGPLAGPVAVCALAATPTALRRFRTIKESKQLTPKARALWDERIRSAAGEDLSFAVSFVSAGVVDRKGISAAIRLALARSLKKLALPPESVCVLLDGGLHAPPVYKRQVTIIRGDAEESAIAMASVVAKVARDRLMDRQDAVYPEYGFLRHKGYGSALHVAAIRRYGLSPLHRATFCTRMRKGKAAGKS